MDRAAAESHVRLLAESELRRAVTAARYRWLDEDSREGGEPPREAGLLRVRAVLSALGQVGALGQATAGRVAMGFTGALAARGLHEPGTLLAPAPAAPPAGAPAAEPRAGAPPGRYQAVPVGLVIPGEQEGQQGEVHVQALVLGPDRAAVVTSFASTWRAAAPPPGEGEAAQPSFPPFGGSGVTDDQGRSYRLTLEPGDGGWYETRVLRLSAVPPPSARWLDMAVGPGLSIRIDLTGPPAIRAVRESRSPPSSGELLLNAVADTLLGGGQLAGIGATLLAGSLAEVTDALVAAGALSPESPAADRLAALCLRRAIEVRGPWAGRAPATPLPASWASVLGGSRCQDGRQGVVPAAVVMPEIDGARFVLAGLSSWERQATVLVFAWGWAQAPREFRPRQPFSWWARDDAGRWHVGRARPDGMDGGTFQLELTPPLHPAARSLDIILTGRSDRVTATLPLAWPGQVAEQQDQGIRQRPGRHHTPRAPGGHGPRGVRGRASPPGPGGDPAQAGRGRLPRWPAQSARRSPASPASDGPGPVRPPWWAALPPAEARIRCGPGEHVLRWADGRLQAMDHDDIEGELVLAALGGDKAGCVAMLEAWGTHADDLDVLALGPRSPADELAVTPELVDEVRAALGPAARSVPMRPWPAPGPASGGGPGGPGSPGTAPPGPGPGAAAAPGFGSLRGGVRPGGRALRGMPARRLSPGQVRARAWRVELLSLFALGRDFQLRLSAQVAAAWSGDVPAGTPRGQPNAQPALVAALAGRLAPAAGPWAGLNPDTVRATLHEGPGWGSVEGDGSGLRAALPLGWLARVWAPGFPVAGGHLIVDVLEVSWPQVRVLGLPAPGSEPAVLSIQPDGEHWSRAGVER